MTNQALNTSIVTTPGVVGGKPRIAGRRITVQHIVMQYERAGLSAEEVADQYDIQLADVYAALAYYHANRTQIDQAIQDDDAFVDHMEREVDGDKVTSDVLCPYHRHPSLITRHPQSHQRRHYPLSIIHYQLIKCTRIV